MPKYLKRNIIIIAFVLLFACIAVYPTRDTLMWHGKVKDTVRRGAVVEREVMEKTVDHQFAYWMDLLTGGIFHHKKEDYPWNREAGDKDPNVKNGKIERDVEVYSVGLTLGLDLEGGAELRYVIEDRSKQKGVNAEKVKEIIRRRIDAMGLKEPIILLENPDRLVIQLPGKNEKEIQRIKNIIESTGHLEFRLVSSNDTLIKQAKAGNVPEGYHWYELTTESFDGKVTTRQYLVSDKVELTGEHIIDTGVQPNPRTRELEVSLNFDAKGKNQFLDTTQNNIGELLAIILDDVRDADGKIIRQGKLYSAPEIKVAIYGSAVITGQFTRRDAEALRTTLQAGSLPAALRLEGESRVGPSLGRDSIESGKMAIIIGFAAVVLFMVIYYHKAGVVATIALFLNLVLIVGALAVIQATLTLPGIAGIILTVGISVDANVLIFERIREEVKKKGSGHLLMAVKDGYARATVTIIDANLTTLITAGVLYMVGTGAVKGFAATLSMGIVFSMFTAIFVTRAIFEFFIIKGWVHELGMFRLIGETSIPFYQKARHAVIVSVALVAIGLVWCVSRGDKNFDTDFKGGTLLHVITKGKVGTDEIKGLIKPDYKDVIVQSIRTKSSRENFSEFEIKTGVRGQARVVEVAQVSAQDNAPDFEGGYKLKIITEKPARVKEVEEKLKEKGSPDASVVGIGEVRGNNAYTEFDIMVRIPEAPQARDTVKNAFAELSVQADIARLLKDKLAKGFPVAERTPEGRVNLEVDFGEPVAMADLLQKLKDWGYDDPSVAVKDAPAAIEGTAIEISATAKDGDPASLQASIVNAYKGKVIEPFARVTSVDGHVAGVMKQQALVAIILSLIFVIGYIWFRFELTFGFGAVIALIHDVGFTVGVLSVIGVPFNLTIIAAILTIIGYSLNDTIVVFDRIRENLRLYRRERYEDIVNMSINQTLARTLLTSMTTLVAVLALLIFGGGVIRNFAITLLVGVVIGTYSSIFIASPFVVLMHKRAEEKRHAVSATMAASRS